MSKTQKKKNRRLDFVIAVCVIGLLLCGWNLYSEYFRLTSGQREAYELENETASHEKGFEIDWNELLEKNPDIAAWIYLPQADISYPVVQGKTNSEYLKKDIEGHYSNTGSIFLDAKNNPSFNNLNSIIYGHSVQTVGGMFTGLNEFEDEDFFNKTDCFYLLTPTRNYRCKIFAFAPTQDQSVFYTISSEEGRESLMQKMADEALHFRNTDAEGECLLTLSTCDLDYGLASDHRFVLASVMEPYFETIPVHKK